MWSNHILVFLSVSGTISFSNSVGQHGRSGSVLWTPAWIPVGNVWLGNFKMINDICQSGRKIFKYKALFQFHFPELREHGERLCWCTHSPTCLINGCILIKHPRLRYNKLILKSFPAGENSVIKMCSKWITSKNEGIRMD